MREREVVEGWGEGKFRAERVVGKGAEVRATGKAEGEEKGEERADDIVGTGEEYLWSEICLQER